MKNLFSRHSGIPPSGTNIKNQERGITLVELIVVIFIIAIFTTIAIADFPNIQRRYALSRAAYKLAQDFRKTEDFGLSGVAVGNSSITEGYGIYFDLGNKVDDTIPVNKQYTIYADTCPNPVGDAGPDYKYTTGNSTDPACISYGNHDYTVETIDISKEDPGVYIKEIDDNFNTSGINSASINFTPPSPKITITTTTTPPVSNQKSISIVLGLDADNSVTRTISINMDGLIEVK